MTECSKIYQNKQMIISVGIGSVLLNMYKVKRDDDWV